MNTIDAPSLYPARLPGVHAQCCEDVIVDGMVAGNKEYRVFVIGRIKGFAQARGHGGDGGDFKQEQAPFVALAVRGQRIERVLCHRREVGISAPDAPCANGCKQVLALVKGVIHQRDVTGLVGLTPEQDTAGHGWPLFGNVWVAEGEYTAACLLLLLGQPAVTAPALSTFNEVAHEHD